MKKMQISGYIGRRTIEGFDHFLNQCAFIFKMFRLVVERGTGGRALNRRFTLEQIYFTGFQALHIIVPVALIVGTTNIVMLSKVSAQYDLGRTMILLLLREIGPLVTALVVILRSATAVTVEIGYMKVLHEIETLEMAGFDPLRVICIPRLFGITVAMLCLFVVFDLVAVFGGYAIVWGLTHIPVGDLFAQIGRAIGAVDILVGFIKAVSFGLMVTAICLYHGFAIRMEITEIPVRASKVAVECFFYCLIVNAVISMIFYR